MNGQSFCFGPSEPIAKLPQLVEVERLSLVKLEEDRAEAQRVREVALAAETPDKHVEITQRWREQTARAEEQHQSRLDYYRRTYLHMRTPEIKHERHAYLWHGRHAQEFTAAPKARAVSRYDFYGSEGLRERYLTKLAIEAAKADGYIFTEDF